MLKIIICIYTAKIINGLINIGEWIKQIYKPYEKSIGDKCLLIIDKASTHASDDSLELLKNNNINNILISSGMTSLLQPMNLSVNKNFKDNIH